MTSFKFKYMPIYVPLPLIVVLSSALLTIYVLAPKQ